MVILVVAVGTLSVVVVAVATRSVRSWGLVFGPFAIVLCFFVFVGPRRLLVGLFAATAAALGCTLSGASSTLVSTFTSVVLILLRVVVPVLVLLGGWLGIRVLVTPTPATLGLIKLRALSAATALTVTRVSMR